MGFFYGERRSQATKQKGSSFSAFISGNMLFSSYPIFSACARGIGIWGNMGRNTTKEYWL